jgi:hypothetical protein
MTKRIMDHPQASQSQKKESEKLSCIVCHGRVYSYPDKFKPGELVYWCPTCKKEGRQTYQKMADVVKET